MGSTPGPGRGEKQQRKSPSDSGEGVPDGVHPLAHRGLGSPRPQERGDAEQQGQEQVREEGLHLHPPAGLQQQLAQGSGSLQGGGHCQPNSGPQHNPRQPPGPPATKPGEAEGRLTPSGGPTGGSLLLPSLGDQGTEVLVSLCPAQENEEPVLWHGRLPGAPPERRL